MVVLNFDINGSWNTRVLKGPAIHAPTTIWDIVVTTYCVEWVNTSDPGANYYSKNHMVAGVVFTKPQWVGGKEYKAA